MPSPESTMRFERKPTPTVDVIAVVAMVLAALAIIWARVALLGTGDIEDALTGEASASSAACDTERLEAVARNRWITGFSQ